MSQGTIFDELNSLEVEEGSVSLVWLNAFSGFAIKTQKHMVIVDPYDISAEDVEGLSPDLVLVSHEHPDHFDKKLLEKMQPKSIIAPPNIAKRLKDSDVKPLSPGETIEGDIKIYAEKAIHPAMSPLTFVIKFDDIVIYHMIDSMNFDELKDIGGMYKPDIAIIPIGIAPGTSPKKGAEAVQMLKPGIAIPHHTMKGFEKFEENVKELKLDTNVVILKKGEIYTYNKSQ